MQSVRSRRLLFIAVALATACMLSVGAIGGVSAEEAEVEVNVEVEMDDPVFEGDGQTVEVEVENPDENENDLIFPLVEIPLGDDLEIPEERQDELGGETFVEGVTVDINGEEEDRTAFIDDSTFRNGDALFIEGEVLEADETKTYAVDLTVTSTNELTVEADVRPLNAEENNVREETAVDPVASGTLDVSTDGDDEIDISSSSDQVELDLESIAAGEEAVDVPGGFDYDVSTELSIVGQTVMISDLTVEEFNTETVEFFDAEPGDAVTPMVVAQTNDATVFDNSVSRSTDRGTAVDPTTQTIDFDAETNGDTTILALEDESDLPMQGIDEYDSDESEWIDHEDADSGVAQLEIDGAFDDTVSVTLEGYFVGDVTLSGEVDGGDAQTIASAVASDEEVSQYGDVNDDGEVTAVDAMKVQQVVDENRTDDYESLSGNGGGGE